MTAIIILSFVFIRNGKDFWAALLIIAGTYIKLYGIVGLAFFFFSDNKIKLIIIAAVLVGHIICIANADFRRPLLWYNVIKIGISV
jgi:predicted lysophospholipase L1 biosynthesis ABC-type transport system permease subunit